MNLIWRPFIIHVNDDVNIFNREAWCKFLREQCKKKDDDVISVLKDYKEREIKIIKGAKIYVFEYYPWDEKATNLAHYFKSRAIDFKPPPGLLDASNRNKLIVYYYELAKAAGRNKVCKKCHQAIEERHVKCPLCDHDKFVDTVTVLQRLAKKVKKSKAKTRVLKSQKQDPNELNSSYTRFKYSRNYRVITPNSK